MDDDDEDFNGAPYERPEDWIRLRKAVRKIEKAGKVIDALVVLVDAAVIMRNVAPWAIIAGGSLLLYLNRAFLLGGGGG